MGLLLVQTLPTLAQSRPAPLANALLARNLRGEEALQSLGNRLKEVAEFHRMEEGELRRLFQRDRSLWVDRRGRLFYACEIGLPQEGPVGESTNSPPLNPLYLLNQTFKLHSRPGASRVIYLDFDGHDASTTAWSGNGSAPIARPFDMDGSPHTFGNTERPRIQYIWARVAEDFLQYDIDVTTEDPGVTALKDTGTGRYGVRVVIGGDSADWYRSDIGGVAFLNSFGDSDRPCWVFPKGLGDNEKSIAEACSHEAGHTLGLTHDGQTTGVEYYTGHGNWAPIMGVGYDRPIVHWSQGEYSQANNSEDDLAEMLSFGAVDRPDDYGDNITAARPLTGVKPFIWGIISSRADVDYFSFEAGAGRATITASPSPRGPNLRLQLSLYDSNGSLITSSNVADNGVSGVLPVTLSTILSMGNYFVSVDGIGSGDPMSDGYTDYASLGQYSLSVTLPGDGAWATTSGGIHSWTNPANWSSGIIPFGLSSTARVNNNITGDQTIEIGVPITIGGLLLGDADASHGFTLDASGSGALRFGATNGAAWINKVTGLNDAITAPVQLQTNLVVTNTTTSDLVLAGPLDGPFTLTKFGSGRLVLTGTNNASAGLVVASGTIQLGDTASVDSVAAITVQAGAVFDVAAQGGWQLGLARMLAGHGVITGDVFTASSSRLAPGAASSPGTLTFANQLTLNNGTTLDFNLGSTTNTGGGINDLIAVAGDLVLTGTITVNFDFAGALPETNGTYTFLTYGGTLNGGATNFAAANAGNRFTYIFDDSVPGEIRVEVSGAPVALVWQGGSMGNLWNIGGATNWLNGGVSDAFFQGDGVLFDPSGSTVPSVDLSGALSPATLTVSNTAGYTFSGSGRISGATSITKQGGGSLTLNTSNDFSGVTLIQDGTLLIGNAAALGLTNAGTTISNTGQLDLNGFALGVERLTLSGGGPAGNGALINTGDIQTNALRNMTLVGETTIGGSARWDIRGIPAASITASLIGNGFALTKTGANEVWLANLGSFVLGSITVNQGTLGFEGANALANNSSSLTVNPGATLAFLDAFDSDFNKTLVLNSCTLQNDSGHNNLTAVATLSGVVTASTGEAATLDMRGTIIGSGGFNKSGVGILRLGNGNTFSGDVTVSEGTLMAGNNAALGSAAGTTSIASGARLDLTAFNLGAEQIFVVGGGINSRGAIINSLPTSQQNALRFVTLTGDTTFGGNGRWDIRANPAGSLLGAFDLTKVGGNEIWLVNLGATQLKTITVSEGTLGFQGTTTMGDAASSLTVNSDGTLGISATGTNILNKALSLNDGRISNGSGSNTLTGIVSLSGANDVDITSGTLVLGGAVTGSGSFNKASAGTLILAGNNTSTGTSLVSAGALHIGAGGTSGSFAGVLSNRASIVFNRTADLAHAAAITGTGTLAKQNTNMLTLSGANTYSGLTTVSAGMLRAGNNSALGATNTGTTIVSGATLDVNGLNLGAEVVTASGAGVSGAGAVINTGTGQNNALRFLTLAGNTTLGGSARWDLRGVSGAGALNTGGQPHALTKTGANTIALNNVTVDPALGNIAVQQGVLSVEQGTTGLGSPAAIVTVSSGAALQLYSLANALNKVVVLEDGAKLSHSGPVAGGISSTVIGPITVSAGNAYVENSSDLYSLQINSAVSGSGNFNKTGAGLVQLNAGNNHSGVTVISAGALKLGSLATMNVTPSISIASGAVLDVTLLGGGFVLSAAQTLMGDGTVIGNLIANGTVAPGASVGRLTVYGNTTLAGNTLFELTKSGAALTNDVLSVGGGTLTCGGTLAVAHTGDPLAENDSFRLFSGGALTGSFTSLSLPALNPGLTWNVSTLNSDGWLRVAGNNAPVIGSVGLNGNGIVITGSGGAPGATFFVLTATNVALPLPQWSPVATNAFDAGGNFAFTNPITTANGQQFFRLRVP